MSLRSLFFYLFICFGFLIFLEEDNGSEEDGEIHFKLTEI